MPLSYGLIDPVRDPCRLNVITFKWDPAQDTGVSIKVNCISTEFTPKKHGGEKGVPFRLQVECFDLDDNRLHATGCVLQVTLVGAVHKLCLGKGGAVHKLRQGIEALQRVGTGVVYFNQLSGACSN